MNPPVLLIVQLHQVDPPARLADWLVGAGLEVRLVDLERGDPLPAAGSYQGLVVLGGGMGAYDDDRAPYLPAVRDLLRQVVADEVPTLAVCLGAQLLAAANGGRVEVNPDGPELGAQLVAKRAAAATDPLFRSVPITPDVIQWHYDVVATLPPGAVHLASSPACENQAFRLGRLAWGVQFHLETTPDVVRTWARNDAARLTDFDLDRIVARADAVHDDLAEVWEPFARAFADIVRDPDSVPSARGIATSTAAPVTDPAAIRAALAAEANAARTQPGSAPLGMPNLPPRTPQQDR